MKKLMMAVAIVCAAAFAQAGAINWGSGVMQLMNEDGSLTGSRLTAASGYTTVKAYVWESFSASDVEFSAGDLYNTWMTTKADDAITKSVAVGNSATSLAVSGVLTDNTGMKTIYGAILYVLQDDTGVKWYMENSGSALAKTGSSAQTLTNLSLKLGGTGAATEWTPTEAIPEPTSALLLLLGMAGLALKRKQA